MMSFSPNSRAQILSSCTNKATSLRQHSTITLPPTAALFLIYSPIAYDLSTTFNIQLDPQAPWSIIYMDLSLITVPEHQEFQRSTVAGWTFSSMTTIYPA
jgi:hypothetical protein